MDLQDFTKEQIQFLCRQFDITTDDLLYMSDSGIETIYNTLCEMGGEMADGILEIIDMQGY